MCEKCLKRTHSVFYYYLFILFFLHIVVATELNHPFTESASRNIAAGANTVLFCAAAFSLCSSWCRTTEEGVSSPQQAFLFNVIFISGHSFSYSSAMTCVFFSEDFLCEILYWWRFLHRQTSPTRGFLCPAYDIYSINVLSLG